MINLWRSGTKICLISDAESILENLRMQMDNYIHELDAGSYERSPSNEAAQTYKRVLEHFTPLDIDDQKAIDKVVFHAVHQFTPDILSVVKQLEKLGIEVVFLLKTFIL